MNHPIKTTAFTRLGLLALLVLTIILSIQPHGQAQSAEDWSVPLNLSHSGAASQPALVADADGTLQAFWWDAFEGMMTTIGDGARWRAPERAPILIRSTDQRGDSQVTRLGIMPVITADRAGWAHAWWSIGPAEGERGSTLMHSGLVIGTSGWQTPDAVVDGLLTYKVVADDQGGLHLVYVRVEHTSLMSAGIYYSYSSDHAKSWSAPQPLYETIYFRLLSAEEAHVDLAVGQEGEVHVTWDDPRLGQSFYARLDSASWSEPLVIESPASQTYARISRVRVVAGSSGRAELLWQDERMAGCVWYQRGASDGDDWGAWRRVLTDLRSCAGLREMPLGDQWLWVAGQGGSSLSLVAWDGASWTMPRSLGFRFEHPELGRQVSLDGLQLASDETRLMAVGTGQGDIWFAQAELDALAWLAAPRSPWSAPLALGAVEGFAGVPALAADAEGALHAVWSVSSAPDAPGAALYYGRWDGGGAAGDAQLRASRIVADAQGRATDPDLALLGDTLHLVWSAGREGEVLYARANVREAYGSSGWTQAVSLPAPSAVASAPRIVADAQGMLHAVYAVPLNESRGIYYTRSVDGGESWEPARLVFDAEAADWPVVDRPDLAVDAQGTLCVAWMRPALAEGLPSLGIYYARSADDGQTWGEAALAKDGDYDWPRAVATQGQLHLLWSEASGTGGWWHQFSSDGGLRWSRPARIQGLRDASGPAEALADGSGALHLAVRGQDEVGAPAWWYLTWDGMRWNAPELYRLPPAWGQHAGAGLALQPSLGLLYVGIRGWAEDASSLGVWASQRAVPSVVVTPAPTLTPLPTATFEPSPTPRPTLGDDIGTAPTLPGSAPVEVPLPVVYAGIGALLLVAGVFLTRPLWMRRR